MSKLDRDILLWSFEELQDDSGSLFSCLLVNKHWCETAITVLWRDPWCYGDNINYCNKSSLYYIITYYLPDDFKDFLTRQGIKLPPISHKSLAFDYLSFCKSINVNVMKSIISIGSLSDYNEFLLQQEIYNLFMKKCRELKYLNIGSIRHQIFYFPNAEIFFASLCKLNCETSIDSTYFYGLARLCNNIEILVIINNNMIYNDGIVKLIEVQKNLKYFEWQDNFDDDGYCYDYDFYEKVFSELEKKSYTLNHFITNFQILEYDFEYDYPFLQKLLPKLYNLKTLIFYTPILNRYNLEEQIKISVYNDLEIFRMNEIEIFTIICMIENSGGHIREILTSYQNYYYEEDHVNEISLILIRTIYENCPLIEWLPLIFSSSKEHFIEFEKLLKDCKKLKVLLLMIPGDKIKSIQEKLTDGKKLLKILIRSSTINLRELRFFDDFRFPLEHLKTFFEKWKGRPSLSIITSDHIYNEVEYQSLIKRYKNDGVIKEFIFNSDITEIRF